MYFKDVTDPNLRDAICKLGHEFYLKHGKGIVSVKLQNNSFCFWYVPEEKVKIFLDSYQTNNNTHLVSICTNLNNHLKNYNPNSQIVILDLDTGYTILADFVRPEYN